MMRLRSGALSYVDRVLDVNPTASLAIAQHNASSPLLRLPLEVKNLIYKYTFGGNIIHIVKNPGEGAAKFKNTICRALISEEEAQENFDNETIHKWDVTANENRHKFCQFQMGTTIRSDGTERHQSLGLSALRCCRQFYNEAHHVPYATNTFACADPVTLRNFILSLAHKKHDNHLAIRSLFVDMLSDNSSYYSPNSYERWTKALNMCSTLKNLQNVNISVEWYWSYWHCEARSPVVSEARDPTWDTPFLSLLFALKELPLKSATLLISDAEFFRPGSYLGHIGPLGFEDLGRWTLEEKRIWARYAKELILK